MQDLTFGEQVKIILSRKDMTIKELAKKVESRTGRKMSRQNLTQRLGRDNFQERDMRMIAEILGCPFQLNILDERTITENEAQAGQKAGTAAGKEPIGKGSAGSVSEEPKKNGLTEAASEEPGKKGSAEAASEEPEKKEPVETVSEGADKKGMPEAVVGEPANDKPIEAASVQASGEGISGESGEKEQPNESNARAHERDITIGELVDIHEELDALMEKATAKELEADAKENHKDDRHVQVEETRKAPQEEQDTVSGIENEESQADAPAGQRAQGEADEKGNLAGDSSGLAEGNPEENAQGSLAGRPGESGQRNPEGNPGRYMLGNMTVHPEEYEGRVQASNSEGYKEQASADYTARYQEEEAAGYPAEYPSEPGGEHVEELLQEIEALEKTEKKEPVQEEKPHGWRAYLKQRFKKLSREQPRPEKETVDTGHGTGMQGTRELGNTDPRIGNPEGGNLEGGYLEEGYAAGGYLGEGDPAGMYAGGGTESAYTGGMYGAVHTEGEYSDGEYGRSHFSGEFPVESYGEADGEEEYSARAYVGGYSEPEYADRTYGEEYLNGGYSEGTDQLELPQEDEEDKGEVNPYTGKEYESNSVRMHPSRIGYVQVYDRANHQWTDMTEWAFLGYQERKKQLLGKDYDPPIYLD